MKINTNTVQPIKGELAGNGTIFGKQAGHQVRKLLSRKQHKLNLQMNPSATAQQGKERVELAKNIAHEICGYAPYEKKAIDFARKGEEKKMRKFLKKRLGCLQAAKKKQDQLMKEMRKMATE